jgi:all-trans-nonaprenyl-diphosphate synthase
MASLLSGFCCFVIFPLYSSFIGSRVMLQHHITSFSSLISPENRDKSAMNLLYKPIHADLNRVKEAIEAMIPPESHLLNQALSHALSAQGKMIRPAIMLLMAKMLLTEQQALNQGIIEAAAVSEMIHVATLLHDDVLDNAALRRGQPTVSAVYGNTVAILAGDYLLAQASLKLATIGNIRVVGLFSQVLADLCDGEVEQLRTRYILEDVSETAWQAYFRKTTCKTASLFAHGAEAIAVLAEASSANLTRLRTFGEAFGIVFQLVDDLLDYTAERETLGKPVLDDLRQGLVNAPVLLALSEQHSSLSSEARSELRQAIEALFLHAQQTPETMPKNTEVEQALIHKIFTALQQANAIEQTLTLAKAYQETAKTALEALPDGDARACLMQLLDAALRRKF